MVFIYLDKNSNYSFKSKQIKIETNQNSKKNYITEINQLFNNELEKIVRKYPEQYFWFHKRFDRKFYK